MTGSGTDTFQIIDKLTTQLLEAKMSQFTYQKGTASLKHSVFFGISQDTIQGKKRRNSIKTGQVREAG